MKMTDAERIYVEETCRLIVDLACAGEHDTSEKLLTRLIDDNLTWNLDHDDVGPN
jgi:hypothetical protein